MTDEELLQRQNLVTFQCLPANANIIYIFYLDPSLQTLTKH